MTKRQALAIWLLCATLSFGCDDDSKCKGAKCGGGDAMNDAGTGGDGDGDGDTPGDGDGDGDTPGDGDGDGDGDSDTDAGPVDTGSITGFVYDTSTPPVGLKDVLVLGPDGKSTMTLDDGSFTLDGVRVGKDVVITTRDELHTRALRNVGVLKDRTSYVDIVVKNMVTASFDPAKGGSVKGSDGAGASFPGGSLQRKDGGGEPTGTATVAVAAIDPTKGEDIKSSPGKGAAKNADNKSGVIKSVVPMEVRVADSEGKDLQIKEGKNADFDFPVSANVTDAPDEIELWSLIEDTGIWKFEGKAFKKRNDRGGIIYRAKIGHMSWWNAGSFVDAVTCVRGCLKDEKGDPAIGAQVVLTGQGFGFREVEITDDKGCYYANVPPDSKLTVLAATATGVSNTSLIQTGTTVMRVEDNAAACQEITSFELTTRPAQGACPTGYTQCDNHEGGFYCADLNNDPNNCGATCDTTTYCSSSGPFNSICMNGTCQCPPGWTNCDGECVNTKTDSQYCGSCAPEKSCSASSQVCNNGACQELTCDDGETVCSGEVTPVCADTKSSRFNCGECGSWCGVQEARGGNDLLPGYLCAGGVCGCEPGLTRCQPTVESPNWVECVDVKTDNNNCGGCYANLDEYNELAICTSTQICTDGACKEIVCADGESVCDRECVNLQTSDEHCGECGISCSDGKSCQNGSCQCPVGQTECQGTCIDPMTDNNNCGGCPDGGTGTVCAGNQTCVGGKCAQVLCLENEAACGNHMCSNLLTDPNNCGGCGNECVVTDTEYPGQCVGGECTCPMAGTELCGLQGYQFCPPTGMCPPIHTAPQQPAH
jgi:hypothetical protein